MNTEFHPIDFDNWDRQQFFYYFTKMMPTAYSISVEVDITKTFQFVKENRMKFFPVYMHLIARLITEQQEFRMAKKENQFGYYDVLHPSYACFHEDDKTISNMWTEYNPDFKVFYKNYMEDQRKYADNHSILAKPDMPPENNFMVGMLPWIEFKHYSPIPFGNWDYYFPVLEGGKFFDKDGKKLMPFSITIHHAVADGYHVGLFLEKFRYGMEHPEDWIQPVD